MFVVVCGGQANRVAQREADRRCAALSRSVPWSAVLGLTLFMGTTIMNQKFVVVQRLDDMMQIVHFSES